ncbi:hypothetical protein VPLG_00064 [Vibrio phage eugene 12A10]|uniref:hypothetical protein n=1 Tax=Vibrio phage eugene 12A10 TaxID=573172 RepID=UPI00035152B6|nr:hypothetical protein VPLG_00064 [Vibrio phage eugene 12A10]AGN51503.1 hypothetical protein VPLG_00064 [Vibrio phage eugene 12A10]
MIKTKEELLNTFIRNEGKLAEIWVKMTGCGGMASWEESYYLCCGSNGRIMFMTEYIHSGEQSSTVWFEKEGYRELTLSDFEPEGWVVSESEVKYKYTLVEIESIFDWKTQLDNKELFYSSEYLPINNEWTLLKLLVEDEHSIYTREEVKWQEEVLSYSHSCDNRHLAKFVLDYPEDFLEAARIALKSIGEIK